MTLDDDIKDLEKEFDELKNVKMKVVDSAKKERKAARKEKRRYQWFEFKQKLSYESRDRTVLEWTTRIALWSGLAYGAYKTHTALYGLANKLYAGGFMEMVENYKEGSGTFFFMSNSNTMGSPLAETSALINHISMNGVGGIIAGLAAGACVGLAFLAAYYVKELELPDIEDITSITPFPALLGAAGGGLGALFFGPEGTVAGSYIVSGLAIASMVKE
ncbi:hypothetical protein HQ533_05595 [Candidatus Woesearchaeota archaeon]|nr:hypothetical protein [Candidatus Woesearchaeota archaeon]